ncbi:MAG: ADP-glyceromanno-heptose 6-epimerase [Hymenobacteraceae bacterium]|nr:ADP-glyceromanno-heptose 6-epimerase [Hymenobacteraceae bacterium]
MIVVTGPAGFIPSCLIARLNAANFNDIIAVDDFRARPDKAPNLAGKRITAFVERTEFFAWLDQHQERVEFVFHLGARTDTAEFDRALLTELNLTYSQRVWAACVRYQLPLVYASSAATYGGGELNYSDEDDTLPQRLRPLNPYGESKNDFDRWALAQPAKPFFWAGLKFFNVYGPNEYHKGRMASVVFHATNQLLAGGPVKLFRSHRPEWADGGQRRDFVYVQDVVDVCFHLMLTRRGSGLYNLGSGQARSFRELAEAVFAAAERPADIQYIDIPADIRDTYQYFTEAPMAKLRRLTGYDQPFTSLEAGVEDYVRGYLLGAARRYA